MRPFVVPCLLIITMLVQVISLQTRMIRKGWVQPKQNPCRMEILRGICLRIFIKYAYNWRTRRCEIFVYGGCGGNENSFDTLQKCMERCFEKDVGQI
ncbi:hypothetical protein FGIG_00517 [Fasciola gigantica]|uniref:BPTI/Kunitz inhibitor domain-containing protein n=1 Tax=Fasciola gigantica TaxID=46835 RepID=A0A504Z1Q7_FASGI|nr:hypothetical protein FGIG_00517 [Fasciola gigantica]